VDHVRGDRVVVRCYDESTKAWPVEDFVELLKNGGRYSIYLRTPRINYKHDKHIFDALVASFAFDKAGDIPRNDTK
jgi:hypothetical protein